MERGNISLDGLLDVLNNLFSSVALGDAAVSPNVIGLPEVRRVVAKVKLSNSKSPKQFFEEEFWIDTGALYSFVPEDYLARIGIEPLVKTW